jgi:hypothetical protein
MNVYRLPPQIEPNKLSAETQKIVPENTRLRIIFPTEPQQQQHQQKVSHKSD